MPTRAKWLPALTGVGIVAAASMVAMGSALPQGVPPEMIDTSKLTPSFQDDFDGNRLDSRNWAQGDSADDPVTNHTLFGNAERQVYFYPRYLGLGIQPVSLQGGRLRITARPLTPVERTVVAAKVDTLPPAQRAPALAELAYSSGRISTLTRFSQKYGYFEMRARLDPGRGLWPAFWLLPATGGWPPEIDVMEVLGHEPETVYATAHSAALPRQTITTTMTPTGDGYHRYGVMWGPDTIDVYVDGAKTGSIKTPPDAHQPMYMIVNLAVGGNWPGYPDAGTKFPATLDVDYVRAWKLPSPRPRR